jgi:hypothetical protein
MRTVLRATFWCCLFVVLVVLGCTSTASATSLVVKVEKDRIIFAADTRRTSFTELSDPPPLPDVCKISVLSKVVFAATGRGTTFHQISGPPVVGDWSADEDAKRSYLSHPDNLFEMAEDWKGRTIQHYATLYSVARQTVEELAGSNPLNVLVIGLFAGWDDKGRPTLITEKISLDRAQPMLSPIVGTENALYERETPYTTNDDTYRLAVGDSELGKTIAKKWAMRAKQFPKSERDWRWLAFLIESTSAYDKTVGKDADVLEIQASGSHWLQRSACGTKRKPQKPASRR